ncbi:sel1 repeat family protein [Pseudomonas sp. gcc21]|uniref:tetratricopeptide repeat protein n=1 Tax=Pseudomonas sp. gcc21 TaxID=2726989 RepID=UPI001451BB78|nr:tetratricopeptide repeat protein [Pseudomonas sp. gcc21]QJD58918.1 sel1 repeat family protein [Pseudomonas sp. gcc21]
MKNRALMSMRAILLGLAFSPLLVNAQSGNPLLISAEDRCALNRVDDESLQLALDNCRAAADEGDMQAQFEMGDLYYQGERIEQDLDTALEWFEEASVQGHPAAQYRLGLMHYQGEGVERNLPQAYIILKMAAINGQDEAMDASDRIATEMNREEIEMATQVLGTLFRNYLNQLRKEEYDRFFNGNGSARPGVPVVPQE